MNKDTSILLSMSVPPYWHCGRTIYSTNLRIFLAMLPIVFLAIWNWGIPALRVMALSVSVAVATEALCQKIMQRDLTLDDLSAVNTGLIFAFLLPAAAPFWLVILGSAISISLGKMVFGGNGANPVSSPLVGWAILTVSFPLLMNANFMQLDSTWLDPLVRWKYFGVKAAELIRFEDLALGHQINALGAGQIIAIFLGGSYLAATGVIRWQITLGFFVGVASLALILKIYDPLNNMSPIFHLCTGSVLLSGFFIATENAISPSRPLPMFIYGLLGGMLTVTIRVFGGWLDGTGFAILLVNLLSPLLDMIRPKPFGLNLVGGTKNE